MDCGSSGSRVFVYFWPPHNGNPHDLLDIKQMRDRSSRPVVKKIKPGACCPSPAPAPSPPRTDGAGWLTAAFPARHLRDRGSPRAGHSLPAASAAVRGSARPGAEAQGDAAVHPVHGGDAAAARAVSSRPLSGEPGMRWDPSAPRKGKTAACSLTLRKNREFSPCGGELKKERVRCWGEW